MATRKTNTTNSVNDAISDAQLANQVKEAARAFGEEKKVKVSIPKTLENQVGKTLPVGVNGVFVVLPVDGTEVEIPETLAKHVKDYINNL